MSEGWAYSERRGIPTSFYTGEWHRDVVVTVPNEIFTNAALIEAHRLWRKHELGSKNQRASSAGHFDWQSHWLSDYANRLGSTLAEWAVSKVTNTYWSGLEGRKVRDTGAGEVKWSYNERYGLFVRQVDIERPDEPYWVVIGEAPRIRVIGCILGKDIYAAGKAISPEGRPPYVVVRQSNITGWKMEGERFVHTYEGIGTADA